MRQSNKNAINSALWSTVEKVSVQGISFIINILLARLLAPSDYGIIAMLSIFIQVATVIIDSGFSNALIQKQNRTSEDLSTAFYVNILTGVFCYLIIFFFSPGIASFYNQPELINISRVYGLSLLISSFTLVQRTLFYIEYKFKHVAIISAVANIIGGVVGILMAINGCKIWSLVVYYIIVALMSSFGFWLFGWWRPKLEFSKRSFKDIFSFGINLLGSNVIHALFSNLYTLVIGKLFSASSLGYFTRGQSLSYIVPSNISNIIVQASYPILCENQNDSKELKKFFNRYAQLSFMLCAPIMTGIAVLALPLVKILLTDKWIECVPFVQILAIGYAFDPIMRLNSIAVNVTGKSIYSLYSEILKKVIFILIIIISSKFGIMAMAVGLAIYSILDICVSSIYVKKVVKVTLIQEFLLLMPSLLYCVLSALVTLFVVSYIASPLLQIILGFAILFVVYILCHMMFSKKELSYIIETIRTFVKL